MIDQRVGEREVPFEATRVGGVGVDRFFEEVIAFGDGGVALGALATGVLELGKFHIAQRHDGLGIAAGRKLTQVKFEDVGESALLQGVAELRGVQAHLFGRRQGRGWWGLLGWLRVSAFRRNPEQCKAKNIVTTVGHDASPKAMRVQPAFRAAFQAETT